ncbi:hypothetical protein O181_093130 [Austropuccinia psidii MF-1]|uniref:Uncharacterized protein n=1 Tax=Austropuccinia psidii MF-1 TaxID=1389203 RepID=A0A9Q3P9T1_9BASI|nr:hypothetical protein [Austropuccinia psidii MF-1]
MWIKKIILNLIFLSNLNLAKPNPLKTSSSTMATIQTPQTNHQSLLVHVLRTEDLIADKLQNQPHLLKKLSHLLISIELGNQTLNLNGHHLPILPGKDHLVQVAVKLKQVQMLKLPKSSPLVPLGLTSSELIKIADKYMSQGIVAAMLTIKQNELPVEAKIENGPQIQANAFKVTVSIKILEIDNVSLTQTNLPVIDLIHLIVHPDPIDPSKVATITTLAPTLSSSSLSSSLTNSNQPTINSLKTPSETLNSLFDQSRHSIDSTLNAIANFIHNLASQANNLLRKPFISKPCSKKLKAHRLVDHQDHPPQPQINSKKLDTIKSNQSNHPQIKQSKLACLIKMAIRSSIIILLFGLPLLFVSLILTAIVSSFLRRHRDHITHLNVPTYDQAMSEKKILDEEAIVLLSAADLDLCECHANHQLMAPIGKIYLNSHTSYHTGNRSRSPVKNNHSVSLCWPHIFIDSMKPVHLFFAVQRTQNRVIFSPSSHNILFKCLTIESVQFRYHACLRLFSQASHLSQE